MRTWDWLSAGVLAVAVALLVVLTGLPPLGWADDSSPLAIPALPPAMLAIPSLDATVRAAAERVPGETVTVTLTCLSSSSYSGRTVPLIVHVYKRDPMAEASRVVRPPSARQEVATAECTIVIESDGTARDSVDLPVTWTSDDQPAPDPKKPAARYYIVLTSPLIPDKAAPVAVTGKVKNAEQQQAG